MCVGREGGWWVRCSGRQGLKGGGRVWKGEGGWWVQLGPTCTPVSVRVSVTPDPPSNCMHGRPDPVHAWQALVSAGNALSREQASPKGLPPTEAAVPPAGVDAVPRPSAVANDGVAVASGAAAASTVVAGSSLLGIAYSQPQSALGIAHSWARSPNRHSSAHGVWHFMFFGSLSQPLLNRTSQISPRSLRSYDWRRGSTIHEASIDPSRLPCLPTH